jgi:hypothetical protein
MYVYTSKCFKNTSIGFYYSCLAAVDTLALFIGCFKFHLHARADSFNITTYSLLSCKFFTSAIYILAQYSAWIIVFANIDRLILVTSNKVVKQTTRAKKLHVGLLVTLLIVILTLNLPNIVYLRVTREHLLNENNSHELVQTCELGSAEAAFYNNNIGDIIDLLVFLLIPFVIMIVSSLLITRVIFRNRLNLKKHFGGAQNRYLFTTTATASSSSSANGQIRKKKKKDLHFSLTILGTNCLFLVLNLPICLVLLVRNLRRQEEFFYETRVRLDLAFTFANIFAYVNFSSSIFINLLLNHIFRNRFKQMIGFRNVNLN